MPLAGASDLFGTKSDLVPLLGEGRIAMPPPRPLGTPHLAYLRALVQKIDPQDAAARYLPNQERATLPEQLRMLQFLQGEFSRADRIRNRAVPLATGIPFAPLDNLLRREVEDRALVRNRAPETRSFEQFADTQPEGFDRAELREIYLNDLATRAHRRRRSSARDWDVQGALRAIDALKEFIQTPAAPAHRIAAWFTPGIVKALAAQNVNTIGELLAFMNQHGYRWYRRAQRIGKLRAARIARWLLTDCRLAAGTLTALALTPRTSLTNDTMLAVREGRGPIRPLQHVVLPLALDGMRGEFRARDGRCTIGAHSDVEAIERWLHAQTNNSNTRRAYEREAERLLQWCVLEKAKPLSSMTTDDAIEYREFLVGIADPAAHWRWRTPRAAWIGRRSQPRASPHWRPFTGGLSKASIERALVIVRSLFGWLNKVGYLDRNAWSGVNTQLASHRAFKAD